jgi:hypothetical protein
MTLLLDDNCFRHIGQQVEFVGTSDAGSTSDLLSVPDEEDDG